MASLNTDEIWIDEFGAIDKIQLVKCSPERE